jgi:fatty-acyl-CoA synthase
VRPDDTAQIQFTSGTTGRPKGVLLTHRALVNNARFSSQRVNAPFGSCWVNTLPMFHTGSCVTMALGALWRRACHVLVEQPDAGSILELLESEHADLLGAVPTILIALREHPTFAQRDLAALRLVISGGASVPVELVRRFETELSVAFCNLYGQTELSPVVAATRPDDCELDKAETVGRPLPHTECAIMDPASGEIVPIGAQGEVCVRGYQVMAGYDGSAQETAATIDDDRWLHTGDLGVMDERGYLRITGRLKDVIIRGGENIYPREVEERLMCHPAVGDAAVIGTPDDRWGEVVAAVIRLSPHAPNRPSPEDLRAWCRDALSPQKTPTSWFVVDELPLTASGKIMKHVLRDMARDNRLPALR